MVSIVEGIRGLDDPSSAPPVPRSRSLSTRLTPECGVLVAGPRVTGARKRAVSWAPEVLENEAKTKCRSDAAPIVADMVQAQSTGGPPPPPPPPPPSPLSQCEPDSEDSADRRKNRRMRIQKQHRDITTEAEKGQQKNPHPAPPPSPTKKQEEVQKANMKFNSYYPMDIAKKPLYQGVIEGEMRRQSAPLPGAYKPPRTTCVSCHQNSAADQISRLEKLQKLLIVGLVPEALQLISDEIALLRPPHVTLQPEPHEISPMVVSSSLNETPARCEATICGIMENMGENSRVDPTIAPATSTETCILQETPHTQSPPQVDVEIPQQTPTLNENTGDAITGDHPRPPTPTIVMTPRDTPCDKPPLEFSFDNTDSLDANVQPTHPHDAFNTNTSEIPPVSKIPPLPLETNNQNPPIRPVCISDVPPSRENLPFQSVTNDFNPAIRPASAAFRVETVILDPPVVAKIPTHAFEEEEEENERKTLELHELAEVMAAAHSNSRRRRRQRGCGDD